MEWYNLEKSKHSQSERKISTLKEGEQDVSIVGRVLETEEPRVINTKKGPRTISEGVIGDETGRVKTTFWGDKAGTVEPGDVVRIEGAWTTSFKGKVQLNVGSKTTVNKLSDDMAPQAEDIPDREPESRGHRSERPYREFRGKR